MTTKEQPPDYKMLAMAIVKDLIAGDKGFDIFRGQPRAGLDLLPKAMRKEFQDGNHPEALAKFRRECSAFGIVANNSLEDLAIAQHYGLATHLLDWTTNPLVALFFASEEAQDEDGMSRCHPGNGANSNVLDAETVKTWEKFFCEAHLIPSCLNRSLSARPLRP